MQEELVAKLKVAFKSPGDTIGSVERNTEIKVVYLTLWALGWDPITEIAIDFHIHRDAFRPPARSANTVDIAVRDQAGVCMLGEVKQWYCLERTWKNGIAQLKRYQKAIHVPRAFLSSGRRWLILDQNGKVADDFEHEDPALLIRDLKPWLDRGKIPKHRTNQVIWRYGIGPSRSGYRK